MKDQKKPWEIGKGFDYGAPIGPIFPVAKVGHPSKGAISLSVNGEVKQNADLSQMTWSVAEQIEKLSEAFELKAGDIILTGTPENVGAVEKGDTMVAKIKGFPDLTIKVV
jgi:2-keto-4-pentenoate hydratase/2-oxohepta-3-ene-1,7-dioic acid hydratase in catechol pathway